ncbi:MAG: tetratricopeptide repeat protein [Novosphingobium sp.]|nr:tetratricopeptide repeat protein [Novosphingobium sp.]
MAGAPGYRRSGRLGRAVRVAVVLSGAALTLAAVPASAQVARAVVQPTTANDRTMLNTALARLARNPRDVDALIQAGTASLATGDPDAAVGFFNRADQLSPENPRIKGGLASAYLRKQDPFDALPLFAAAERGGPLDSTQLSERGLAYDLVGDNGSAQRFYVEALQRGWDDETVRRLALSQAIGGDRRASEATLSPLLQRQDRAAWRTRAFALAIVGQEEEAVSIAKSTMPGQLADGVAPYLRYMRRLTRAQQAAAANLGFFPRAADIGRDDPRVALYAPGNARMAGADSRLIPSGEPLGRRSSARAAPVPTQAVAAPAPVRPAAAPRQAQLEAAPPQLASTHAGPPVALTLPPAPPPTHVAAAPQPALVLPTPARASTPALELPAVAAAPAAERPGFSSFTLSPAPAPARAPSTIAAAPAATAPAPAPAPAAPVVPAAAPVTVAAAASEPAPAKPRSLAEAFADFAKPTVDAAPAPGAIDIRKLGDGAPPAAAAAAKTAASAQNKPMAAAPKAPKPAHAKPPPPPRDPSRVWVQVATGRDTDALAFDWRRITREAAAAMRGRSGYVSDWGKTNRLVTGPFDDEDAATAFIAQLRRAHVTGAFVWTSPAGQAVEPLAGK